MRAKNLVVIVIALSAMTSLVTASLGGELGFQPETGIDTPVNDVINGIQDGQVGDSVTSNGEVSFFGAFSLIIDFVQLPLLLPQALVNLGIPPAIAYTMTIPVYFAVPFAVLQIAIRQRL